MAEGADSGASRKTDRDELVGRTIAGKYDLLQLIGSGATGTVYRARHLVLEKSVALKILDPDLALSDEMVELFKHEAKAASRIDHPNSVRILDFGSDEGGLLYLAMEFVEGPDLLQFLEERFPLEHRRVIDIMSQLLGALAEAHELGVIHRDLKPENVLVLRGRRDDGQVGDIVKVCDFGVAQLSPAAVPARPLPRADREPRAAIDVNYLVGTPEYMSPEQARGEPLDPRSDVYAAGVVLFQLLTGRLPFEGESPGEIATLQCDAPAPRPSSLQAVPAALEAVCLTALNKDPLERYQSAREMRAALQQVVLARRTKTLPLPAASAPSPATARAADADGGVDTMNPPPDAPVPAAERLRRPKHALAAFTALTASGLIALYFATRGPAPAQPVAASAAAAQSATPAAAAAPVQPALGALAQRAVRAQPEAPAPMAAPARPHVPAARPPSAPRKVTPAAAHPAPVSGPAPQPPERNPPAPRAKTTPAIAIGPLLANIRIGDVSVHGPVAVAVVQRAIDRVRARFSDCYGRSARAAGHNGYGTVQLEVEFDDNGRARAARADGGALPGLDACLTDVAGRLVTGSPKGTGSAKASWRIAFVP